MALAQATITFDVSDYTSADFDVRRTKVYATNNVPGGTVIDTVGNHIFLGSGTGAIASDGTGSIAIPTPGAGSNPASWQTTIFIDYADRNKASGREVKAFGPFTITTSANLADLVAEMPVQPEYAAEVFDRLDALEADSGVGDALAEVAAQVSGYTNHGNVSGSVTFNGPTASHRFTATGPTTITLSGYDEGQVATLICFGGAEDVLVTNAGDVTLVDNTAWSAELAMGAWISGGGGGTPATPDTTPPSAVTDLAVTPGGDGVTATATFTAATDTESTVKYRYRLYPTGGTVPAWPTSGSQYNLTGSPINLAGLTTSEDYTMELQAYSAGGSAAADTATFSTPTPAGWNTIITDAFTASDGSALGGRTPTTAPGGTTWSVGLPLPDALHIMGNRVNMPNGFGYLSGKHTLDIPASTRTGMRVSADYELASQLDTQPGGMALRLEAGVGDTNNLELRLEKSGSTATWTVAQGNGLGNITMNVTTPLPLTGRLGLQVVGTAVTVLLNDTAYATGTASYNYKDCAVAALALSSGRTSYLDNFKVEVYT